MSARDDYPLGRVDVGSLGVHYTVEPGVWHNLCDELDSLRRQAHGSATAPSPIVGEDVPTTSSPTLEIGHA